MALELRKPEVSEVHDFLRGCNALIVHFSGAPKGSGVERGSHHLFPADLRHVVAGSAKGGLSCSVVRPGDIFHGREERNAMGSIGVVLDLNTKNSLVAVHPSDCGSIEDKSGNRRLENECDITSADMDLSLDQRKTHNEWIVRDYVVRGVFAAWPYEVSILEVPCYPDDMPDYLRANVPVLGFRCSSLKEVAMTFPNLPIYTFKDTHICRYDHGELIATDHAEIYP